MTKKVRCAIIELNFEASDRWVGMFEQKINIDRMEQAVALFGSFDENIKLIENEYHVVVVGRGSEIKVSGEPEDVANILRSVSRSSGVRLLVTSAIF